MAGARSSGALGPWQGRGWSRVVRVGPRACIDHRREAGPIAEAGLSESIFMPGPVPGGLESSGGVWDVRVITRSEVLAGGLVGPVLGDWVVPVGIRDEPGMTVGGGPRAPCSRGTSSKATQAYRQGGYSNLHPLHMFTPSWQDMLLRGVGPHSHPRTESSGVVWGRPSPPALGSWRRGAMCRSRRGACLQSIGHPGRSDLHLLVAVLASPQMPCERGHEACTHRGWPGGVGASGPSVHGMSREEQQGGPESTRSFRVRDGE